MQLNSIPCRNPEVHVERVDEDVLAYHPRGDRILKFNPTVALIWDLCDGQRSVAEIRRLLCAAYPGQADRIPADLESTLQSLADSGCIGGV